MEIISKKAIERPNYISEYISVDELLGSLVNILPMGKSIQTNAYFRVLDSLNNIEINNSNVIKLQAILKDFPEFKLLDSEGNHIVFRESIANLKNIDLNKYSSIHIPIFTDALKFLFIIDKKSNRLYNDDVVKFRGHRLKVFTDFNNKTFKLISCENKIGFPLIYFQKSFKAQMQLNVELV